MPLLAILIDIITVGSYMFQSGHPSTGVYTLGLIVQAIATIILIIWSFSYRGRKYRNGWLFGLFSATVSYGIILISAVINALVLVLYAMNLFGINSIIFGSVH